MSKSEIFRAREVYRYYQPRDLAAPVATPESITSSSSGSEPKSNPPKETNYTTQQSFSDTALTAFAQLIALRLHSQRAIVSLSDHENEYFLAESTSTLSLLDEDGPAQNAWLSISGARVQRGQSLCENTLRLVPNQQTTKEMTPWDVVPDLQLDDRLKGLNCVEGAPFLRFYCGVPLTNKNGVTIGCVYVVDDRPRTDITLDQAQFLTRMAATIMDHMEGIRAKEDIVRVTMMSQALHAFIEGDGTMDGDWQRLKKYNLPAKGGVGFRWESTKNDGSGSYFNGQKQLGSGKRPALSRNNTTSPVQSPLQHTGSNTDARYNFNNSPWSSSSEVVQIPALRSVFDGVEAAEVALDGGRDSEYSNDGFSNLLHSTFSRASNLIREGMEVDGAVFFDAPFRFYQGRSTLETDSRNTEMDGQHSSGGSGDESTQSESRPGPRPRVVPVRDNSGRIMQAAAFESGSTMTMGLKSDVLGFSTGQSSSLNNPTGRPDSTFAPIEQSLLSALVRRYPQGELFVFDQEGPISPDPILPTRSGSEVTLKPKVAKENQAHHRARKRSEILRLWASFPGARQIFFVPLYDSTSGCFIGSFAWSTSATRIFSSDNHLSYLVAFGHSVMSEVSRLNTLSADRAKGDFISNVSHELRSPLHGILASVEFLADTELDGFQRNLIDTVDICGRTLLDTIEHVLDFSKIKKFGQKSPQSMGVVTDLDVSAVIEEVLEGIFAGFEFNGLSSQGLADTTKSRSREPSSIQEDGDKTSSRLPLNEPPTVIMDIDFRSQWKFPTVPGTWRRLTMNIFGNALKNTPSGFIKIKLEARAILPSAPASGKDNRKRTMVTLTMTDTGVGMSSDFMKTKLFMPFSQEDVTAPGTGLGMSIVKQIVDLSGGRIDVRSEKGKGTEITLSLPLEDGSPKAEDYPYVEDKIKEVRRRTSGRTVSIQGFQPNPSHTLAQAEGLQSFKSSMEKFCTQWFNLSLVAPNAAADISISDESIYQIPSLISDRKFKTLIIICSNGTRRDMDPSRLDAGQIVEFVSKPCGPHRLAKALLNCLDTESRVSGCSSPSTLQDESGSEFGMAAAGESKKLIDLQSSIGFSPTSPVEAIRRTVGSRTSTQTSQGSGRPKLIHSTSSPGESSGSEMVTSQATTADTHPDLVMGDSEDSIKTVVPVIRKPYMLLVEDNPVNMMLLATYMKKNSWEFEKANNGLEALEAFKRRAEGFDVIFMDVSMPIMNGYESTRGIRAVESSRRQAKSLPKISPRSGGSATSFPFLAPPSPVHSDSEPASRKTSSNASPNELLASETKRQSDAQDVKKKEREDKKAEEEYEAYTNLLDSMSSNADKSKPTAIPSIPEEEKVVEAKEKEPALIIALTGFSSQKDQEMAFKAGVDIFMTKPVRFREVGKILEGWMGRDSGGGR